jgi:hypothetical protein
VHPADPSSTCVRASWRSRWASPIHNLKFSSAEQALKPACIPIDRLPFPLVPSSPGQRGHDKTFLLPHCALIVAPVLVSTNALLEGRVIIASYNDHCPAPFYLGRHGWFGHRQAHWGLGARIVMDSITLMAEDLGRLFLAFFVCMPQQFPQRDKRQKQRGRNRKEDIFTNPVSQGRKVQ